MINETDIQALYDVFKKYPDICIDTRKISKDCLFFALSGSNFNGNIFATQALQEGAAYAVVSDASLSGDRYIHVANSLTTLQQLARYHRQHFQHPYIAITGTNGKTTTKELVTTVLSTKYRVHATAGNFNNHIGVPLTLLSMSAGIDMAVIEMGANHIGEIHALCEIAMPTHGIITNIGKAHLEGFGSLEGIQKAKGELFEYLNSTNGHAFVNADDPRVMEVAVNLINKTLYGFDKTQNPALDFHYHTEEMNTGFTLHDEQHGISIASGMFGQYNAMNMLAAYTIGHHFKVEPEQMAQALSSFVPGANRSEVISHRGCTIIKDAYNANPSSMELAVRDFSRRYPGGIAILGDMKELGHESLEAHMHMIRLVLTTGLKKVYFVGEHFQQAISQFPVQLHLQTTLSIEDLINTWSWEKCQGSAILLKGSRSMQLEKLISN